MFDYGNMPSVDWTDPASARRARAQVLHQEPVILRMPNSADLRLDASACGCSVDDASGILIGCRARDSLEELAGRNGWGELRELAAAAERAGAAVDIDPEGHRVIIHD